MSKHAFSEHSFLIFFFFLSCPPQPNYHAILLHNPPPYSPPQASKAAAICQRLVEAQLNPGTAHLFLDALSVAWVADAKSGSGAGAKIWNAPLKAPKDARVTMLYTCFTFCAFCASGSVVPNRRRCKHRKISESSTKSCV